VYRNLVVLEEAGVVRRMMTRDEFARYELAEDLTGHHHHLVCSTCGRVEDLPATPGLERSVAAAVDEAARRAGFRTQHHRLDLVGVCSRCT
jgi:Fe2+ or Zn2+ uptake regulation protein